MVVHLKRTYFLFLLLTYNQIKLHLYTCNSKCFTKPTHRQFTNKTNTISPSKVITRVTALSLHTYVFIYTHTHSYIHNCSQESVDNMNESFKGVSYLCVKQKDTSVPAACYAAHVARGWGIHNPDRWLGRDCVRAGKIHLGMMCTDCSEEHYCTAESGSNVCFIYVDRGSGLCAVSGLFTLIGAYVNHYMLFTIRVPCESQCLLL